MAMGDREDELLTAAVCALEDYLDDQQQAAELLKQGFLKLTMARMSLPSNVLGEISYKDQFEAALSVKQESDGSLTVVRTADVSDDAQESDHDDASTLKRRGGEKIASDSSTPARTASGSNAVEDEAIMWFSSLPPQHLRLAQKHFRRGLHALIRSALSARKIQQNVNALQEPIAT